MARRNLFLPLHKCDLCSFASKNAYIYKRHRIRCKREHGLLPQKKSESENESVEDTAEVEGHDVSEDSFVPGDDVPSTASLEDMDGGDQVDGEETSFVKASKPAKNAAASRSTRFPLKRSAEKLESSASASKPLPPVRRNYQCMKCTFTTTKSRAFLFHQIEEHNAKTDVFACNFCEYCCPYKHKIQRHMKLAHKVEIPYDSIKSESVTSSARMKKVRKKVMISKSLPGKKLMVKFVKPSHSKSSQSTSQASASATSLSIMPFKDRAPSTSSVSPSVSPSISPSVSPAPSSASGSSVPSSFTGLIEEIPGQDGTSTYKCRQCLFNSTDKQQVVKHAMSWHVDTKTYSCQHCSFTCFTRPEAINHRSMHRDKHAYRCDECTYSTDFRPNFDRHMNNHRGDFPHKCLFCSYGCTHEGALKRHMLNNHDSEQTAGLISADTSEHGSSHGADMNRELSAAGSGGGDQMQLPVTSLLSSGMPEKRERKLTMKMLSPQKNIRLHVPPGHNLQRENGRVVCMICSLRYKRSSDLNRHMKKKHNIKLRDYLLKYGSADSAPTLVAAFPSGADVLLPDDANEDVMDTGEEEYVDIEEEEDKEGRLGDELPLDLSVKSSSPDSSFEVAKEKLKCPHCSYIAKWSSDYRRHMAVHSLEKRYKCPYCIKKYKYLGDLNVHVRKDHKKEPSSIKAVKVTTVPKKKTSPALFKCPCCPYTSAWKSEVDRHSRLHTEEKPFQCRQCDYQTYWKGDIRRHIYKHHPDLMTEGVALDDVIILRADLLPQFSKAENAGQTDYVLDQDVPMETSLSSIDGEAPNLSGSLYYSPRPTTPTSMSGNLSKEQSPATSSPSTSRGESAERIFKCDYCSFTANAPSKMNAHIATHTNLKQFKCPVCGRRANWKWDIAKHIKKDHPESDAVVIKLSKEEAEKTIQEYMESNPVVRREHHLNLTPDKTIPHITDHTSFYKCSDCDFSADKRISVTRHIRYTHGGGGANVLVVPREDPMMPSQEVTPVKTTPTEVRTTLATVTPPMIQVTPPGTMASPEMLMPVPQAVAPAPVLIQSPTVSPVSAGTVLLPMSNPLATPLGTPIRPKPTPPTQPEKQFMCAECGKHGMTKGDIKKHYHYRHPGSEIRIVYVGKGGQPPVLQKPPSPAIANNVTTHPARSPIKVPHPKVLGYIRPFKCSICGRRSNWRWDLNKHIRDVHRGMADIITLPTEEARATMQEYMATFDHSGSQYKSNVRKTKPVVQVPKSPVDPNHIPSKGVFKQYKCSVCPYRTNWRSDLMRHINRRHGPNRAAIIVMDPKVAEETLSSYTYSRFRKRSKSGERVKANAPSLGTAHPEIATTKIKAQPPPRLEKKMWKCSMCSYMHDDKFNVLKHLSKHNMKAYRCLECNYTADFRTSVYRHIRGNHGDDMSLCKLSIKIVKEGLMNGGEAQNVKSQEEVPMRDGDGPLTFFCKLCPFRSSWRSCVCRHIRDKHNTKDYIGNIGRTYAAMPKLKKGELMRSHLKKAQLKRSQLNSSSSMDSTSIPDDMSELMVKPAATAPTAQPVDRKKKYKCTICPYRSQKPKMLKFHMSCHKPQPGVKQAKCKYCPYYVCGARLLQQHIQLHLHGFMRNSNTEVIPAPKASPSKNGTPKRHRCEKCPYTTNSKNDFLYHKQFHRPKPTADHKCEHCDYWVTHKRLLKQHMKVHGEYAERSIHSSPSKSEISETSSHVFDLVEMAAIKQRIIASKITPSLSQTPVVSPMKLASHCSIGNRPGYVKKDGVYRKIHKCHLCPYMNIRPRNLRLHELMHGPRQSSHPLMKCPHCDYYVGSKGLLAHHLKVHQPNYGLESVSSPNVNGEHDSQSQSEQDVDITEEKEIPYENKVDTLLEIARFKKYCCEKCPYASSKRAHFERHMELHGSKQRCTCEFCDYSVPSQNLLAQHRKLHFQPNQNLLAAQSISNLQYLPEVPADVALSGIMPMLDSKEPVSVTHDHMELYENSASEMQLEPKKIYRCDRCPYANVRRDHLMAHLRCHMFRNEYSCPYCDYSVGKPHVLAQHIKAHFSPLPELSDWLAQNGQMDRVNESKEPDIREAIEVAQMLREEKKMANGCEEVKTGEKRVTFKDDNVQGNSSSEGEAKDHGEVGSKTKETEEKRVNGEKNHGKDSEKVTGDPEKDDQSDKKESKEDGEKIEKSSDTDSKTESKRVDKKEKAILTSKEKVQEDNEKPSTSKEGMEVPATEQDKVDVESMETEDGQPDAKTDAAGKNDVYICQYCDREFSASDQLVRHEMQHLIGNNFEDVLGRLKQASGVPFSNGEEICEEESSSVETEEEDPTGTGPGKEKRQGSRRKKKSSEETSTASGDTPMDTT